MKTSVLHSLLFIVAVTGVNAQSWTVTRTNVPGVVTISDIAYGNGRFLATTGGSVHLVGSADGVAWQALPAAANIGPKLLFIGGSFYAIGNSEIWRSADGEAWTRVVEGAAPGGAHSLAATDGRGILTAASNATAALLFSPDMRTFRPAAPLPNVGAAGTMSTVTGVAHGAGRYFVSYLVAPIVPGNSVGYVVSTVDGTAWTHVATGHTTRFQMAGNTSRFVAFMDGNRTLVTADGTTFATYPLPFPLANGDSLVTGGGRFFMSRSLMSSLDGVAWSSLATSALPASADLRGFTYGRGKYVAAGFTQTNPPVEMLAYLTAPAPPVFASEPASTAVAEGQPLTLTATLDNPGVSTTFQWRREGVAIPGATFPIYTVPSATPAAAGRYTLEARNALGATVSHAATVTVVRYAEIGRIVNLSILSELEEPGASFVLGFVITGTSGRKPLLVRAAGPALTQFGVASPNADPRLELFAGAFRLGENDDWAGSAELTHAIAQVGAFPYSSADSKDAAFFDPGLVLGNHTVRISANGTATGPVIAELYDATPTGLDPRNPRLANVSVLKRIAANTTLSAGFVIGGRTEKTVLIRAIGPGLGQFGLANTLADPRLTLYQSGFITPLATNDDWHRPAISSTQVRATFSALGAFDLPGDSRDAALLLTLGPGSYVAEVSGAPNTAGEVLVEVYEVP